MRPLVDRFGRVHRYLRISLTDRCNLACNYCMPTDGTYSPSNDLLNVGEIERVARVLVQRCGITKIRLTGGEPTTRSDFPEILKCLSNLGLKDFGITTNGVLLKRYWDDLIAAKVGLVNISMDTLDSDKFELISNKPKSYWERTWEAINEAKRYQREGAIKSLKINTVVMRHVNNDELVGLVEKLTKDDPIQLRFIELMPFAGNNFSSKLFMSKADILEDLSEAFPLRQVEESGGVTSSSTGSDLWKVKGFRGTVGVISSMTDNFCGSCDRLRITADGNMRNCLFDSRTREVKLVDVLRKGGNDDEIEALFRSTLSLKDFSHGGLGDSHDIHQESINNRSMIGIGG
jgi:molybdenum cofactor biosynthesis protein A